MAPDHPHIRGAPRTPRHYTASHAAQAVRLFLIDQGHHEPIETCPLKSWVQQGPDRFVFREEGESEIACTVQFDDRI